MSKERFFTSTGVELVPYESATSYAKRRGLKDICIWIATFPDGHKKYMISRNGEAIYEDSSLDGIGTKIDILSLVEQKHDHQD